MIKEIGYLEPKLYLMAADWRLALTPGGVDQDLPRLGHCRIHRPMWPFDTSFAQPPDLTARLIPSSNEAFPDVFQRCLVDSRQPNWGQGAAISLGLLDSIAP